jgi:hypothetical protein
MSLICRAVGGESKKDWGGDAEVDVEVAGDHRSRIVVALSTDFRSECHLDEILLQSVFGVFQQYPPEVEIPGSPKKRFKSRRQVQRFLSIHVSGHQSFSLPLANFGHYSAAWADVVAGRLVA